MFVNKKILTVAIVLVSSFQKVHSQCPNTVPTGIPACRISTGEVELGASGSTGYYSWYDAAVGGNFLGVGSTFTTPTIAVTTDYFVAAANVNASLDFDGANDYVAIGNPAGLQIIGDMTIEMWLKPVNFSARRNPYAKAYGGEGTITQETSGTLNYYYGTAGANASPYQGFNSVVSIELNQWNHIAIVRDLTNGQLYWYINGVLTNQTAATYGAAVASGNAVTIGAGYVSNYAGQIDEVRVWNTARTQAEIQNNMDACLLGTEPGLAAYWQFNDNAGTTLTDASSNGFNGTLTNMDPATDWLVDSPAIGCASCESSRTTVTATVSGGTPVNLGNNRCFNVSEVLDAGAGMASYLWQDGSTNQTFTATTSGTYYVQITDGSGCIDRDTVSLVLNPVPPTGTGSCRIGTGVVQLSASGSSGNYNWYDAPAGGNFLGTGSSFTTPEVSLTTNFYVAAAPDNYSLDFDGTDDYVAVGNPSELQISGDLTIEMWLKPANFSARRNPYNKAYGGEGTITQETNGTLNFYYGTSGADAIPYQGFNSLAALNLNEWNHIAIVRDLTNMQLYWYINGVLTNQTAASYATATIGANQVFIGDGYVSPYAGRIDEVRVWKSARTQAEIQSNITTCCDCQADPNLVAYWDFDDAAGTTLTDKSNNANHGTLTNMNPATDWVLDGGDRTCESCESNRVAVTATVTAGGAVNLGADENLVCSGSKVLDAGAGYASYLWQDASASQTFTATTGGTYYVQVTDGSGCIDQDTIKLLSPGSAKTALDLDGVDDYIRITNTTDLQITGDQTIEMWLYPRSFASRQNPYNKAYGGTGTLTQETSGVITYFYGTSGGDATPYQGFNTSTPLTLNEWNHVAIVRDLTNMQLYWYVNGEQTNTTAANFGSAVAGVNNVLLGDGYTNNYNGIIEEVRIWSEARSQTQIRDNMGKRLLGSEPNLVAYYRMDDAAGTTLSDATANLHDGTLVNMDPATDWVTSTAPVGDLTATLFTNSWAGQTLNMTPCGRDDATISNMTGSPTGVLLYYIGAVPNDVTGITNIGNNDRYFGVHKFNDNTANYTFTYNYFNNPHIDISDESNLLLFSRTDATTSPWVDAAATIDVGANTLTATAQSTEFMLGSNGVPLPVTLLSFEATAQSEYIALRWQTASELNNDFFTLQRSVNGETFEDIAKVPGAGTSTKITSYGYKDYASPAGNIYYRLLQTDFDGTVSMEKTVLIQYKGAGKAYVQAYPNPSSQHEGITLQGGNFKPEAEVSIRLVDVAGRLVKNYNVLTNSKGAFKLDLQHIRHAEAGVYMLLASDRSSFVNYRLILE